jgi:hypothetical protein
VNLVIGVVISGLDNAQKEVAERQLDKLLKHDKQHGIAELERHEKVKVLRKKTTADRRRIGTPDVIVEPLQVQGRRSSRIV